MDKTTTTFPKVGTAHATATNTSGKPSTASRPKGGPKGSAMVDLTGGHKRNVNERLGACYAPSSRWAPMEDPAASANLRNTRRVPSAKGTGEFLDARRRLGGGN
ncbi:hypothetical protein FDA94_28990 [Herbidospora galbida]|uniref:Uncharacterized protein n=1 Tax=Herbidospora galbida TaxID=2575442 RepID=A0A4U3M9B7_9ACTN|nr:hypothetical protein [Herbidospora galbida]TKK84654.1 hypothetical protein FDA94_28990 [Herbidospora galbida]